METSDQDNFMYEMSGWVVGPGDFTYSASR